MLESSIRRCLADYATKRHENRQDAPSEHRDCNRRTHVYSLCHWPICTPPSRHIGLQNIPWPELMKKLGGGFGYVPAGHRETQRFTERRRCSKTRNDCEEWKARNNHADRTRRQYKRLPRTNGDPSEDDTANSFIGDKLYLNFISELRYPAPTGGAFFVETISDKPIR